MGVRGVPPGDLSEGRGGVECEALLESLGVRMWGSRFRSWGSGVRVWGEGRGIRVSWGLGCRGEG